MRRRLRHALFFLVVLGLGLHFTLTIIYCLPADKVGARAASYAGLYTYPAFHQGWALFAPDPQLKGKRIDFRYAKDGEWGEWIRPDETDYGLHTRWRFTYHSKRYQMMQNCAFYLWQEVEKRLISPMPDKDYYPGTFGYEQAVHFAEKWQLHHLGGRSHYDSLQVRLVLTEPFAPVSHEIHVMPAYIP